MRKVELKKRKSSINGFGIFTSHTITKDEEFYIIPLTVIHTEPHARCARIADGKYVHDDAVLDWVNHSCAPNATLDIDRPDPVLSAIRTIEAGEEIVVDYNQTEVQGITTECSCKALNCKGYFIRL